VDRRAAVIAGADPADLRRSRLLAVAGRGGVAGLLPDARLAVLPATTHVGVTRRPGDVLALITPFLDAC
jgi:hypothetical protein